MQAAIGAQFGLGRGDLGRRRQHGQQGEEKGDEQMHGEKAPIVGQAGLCFLASKERFEAVGVLRSKSDGVNIQGDS